jgi:hypothetical protein
MLGTYYGYYVSMRARKKPWQPLIDMGKKARKLALILGFCQVCLLSLFI